LPQQRKLSKELKEEAQKLISLQVNKKLLRDHLARKSGKTVMLKDISNIAAAVTSNDTRNDIDESIKLLKHNYGRHYYILHCSHCGIYVNVARSCQMFHFCVA